MQAQTKSLAQALQSAQQAMQDTRQGTNGAPQQARQGADRVPTEGRQQGASMTSSQARQAVAPKLARQVRQFCSIVTTFTPVMRSRSCALSCGQTSSGAPC